MAEQERRLGQQKQQQQQQQQAPALATSSAGGETNMDSKPSAAAAAATLFKNDNRMTHKKTDNYNNPFYRGARDNFPSLDRALASSMKTTAARNKNHHHQRSGGDDDAGNSSGSGSGTPSSYGSDVNSSPPTTMTDYSLDLSIDARAALHEHLRHVAKFGIDNDNRMTTTAATTTTSAKSTSNAKRPPHDDNNSNNNKGATANKNAHKEDGTPSSQRGAQEVESNPRRRGQRNVMTGPHPPSSNTLLDDEWEQLLEGNHAHQQQDDFSFQHSYYQTASSLSPPQLPTFDRLQVLTSGTLEDAENNGDAVEVAVVEMTRIEAEDGGDDDDYFNSSKVWQLFTPEKNRKRQPMGVTDRRRDDEEEESDEYGDDNDEEQEEVEDTTPESACNWNAQEEDEQEQEQVVWSPLRASPLSASPQSQFQVSSPVGTTTTPTATDEWLLTANLPQVAAAAAAVAREYQRNPSRVASVALTVGDSTDFVGGADDPDGGGGLCNSLLATSTIHEDAPLITSPFQAAGNNNNNNVIPDPEGSFADWSFQSLNEHSFALPSAVTPIRPLPPLSPVHSIRCSPPSSSSLSATNQNNSNSSRNGGSNNNGGGRMEQEQNPSSSPSSQRASSSSSQRGGSPRSSTSSSSSFGKWRLTLSANSSPQRGAADEPDFCLREDIVSPIQKIEASPHRFGGSNRPRDISALPSIFDDNDDDDDADDDPDEECNDDNQEAVAAAATSLSPSAKLAANTAARLLQGHTPSLRPRGSSIKKNLWPSPEPILQIQSTEESMESSSMTITDDDGGKRNSSTSDKSAPSPFGTRTTAIRPEETKEAMTAPIVSTDTMTTTGCSHMSVGDNNNKRDSCCSSPALTTRSADAVLLMDRRKYRTVVPRRIIFPEDCQVVHHDSFDRPVAWADSF